MTGATEPRPTPAGPLDPTHTDRGSSSVDLLRRNGATFRMLCDRFGVEPVPQILERVAALYDNRPGWVTAESHPTDLLILYLAARGVRPARVVEIGVASGLSTCALLAGLADAGVPHTNPADGRETVQSFDILDHVPWDKNRPIGSVIPVLAPELKPWSRVHTSRTSMDLERELGSVPVDLAFIDGSHNHPWPLIDAIQVSRTMSGGAWMILHDVALVERALVETFWRKLHQLAFEPTRGAEWLFEMWPSAKIRPVNSGHNVAIVQQVPTEQLRMHENLQTLAALPWESAPPPEAVSLLRAYCGDKAVTMGMHLGRPGADLLGF